MPPESSTTIRDHNFPESTGATVVRYKCAHSPQISSYHPSSQISSLPSSKPQRQSSPESDHTDTAVAFDTQHHATHTWLRQLACRIHHPGLVLRQCCSLNEHHFTELQDQVQFYSQDHSDPRSPPRPSSRPATGWEPKQHCTKMQSQVQLYCQNHRAFGWPPGKRYGAQGWSYSPIRQCR